MRESAQTVHLNWLDMMFSNGGDECSWLSVVGCFYRVQKEQMEAEEQAQRLAGMQRRAHATEIRKQVRQKEHGMIEARRQYFEEGIKLDQEAKERSWSIAS